MRKYLRSWLINSISLVLLDEFFPGFFISEGLKGVVIAGLGLTIANLILKPILKTIFLPINLLTLGTLGWIINALNLALLAFFIPQMTVKAFPFTGLNFQGIIIQPFRISWLLSLILASVVLTLIKKIILKIIRKSAS